MAEQILASSTGTPPTATREVLIAWDPIAQQERWRVATGNEEFAGFGWQGEVPDPQDEKTFLRCQLNQQTAAGRILSHGQRGIDAPADGRAGIEHEPPGRHHLVE